MPKSLLAILFLTLAVASPAAAQSTSGVSGSDVRAGETSIEYRFAFSPDNDGRPENFAHRFHVQHSFDGKWRGRALIFISDRDNEAVKVQGVGAEVLYQFLESEKSHGWDSAIRVDATLATVDGRPDRIRAGWHNAFDLGRDWELRAVLLVGGELGDNARDGLSVETREELTVKLSPTLRVGAQAFNNFNTTAHFGSFDEQRHQVGPVLRAKLTKKLKLEASALFGISDDPTDVDVRVFAAYGF